MIFKYLLIEYWWMRIVFCLVMEEEGFVLFFWEFLRMKDYYLNFKLKLLRFCNIIFDWFWWCVGGCVSVYEFEESKLVSRLV